MSVTRGMLAILYVAAGTVAAAHNLTAWTILMSAMIIANTIGVLIDLLTELEKEEEANVTNRPWRRS